MEGESTQNSIFDPIPPEIIYKIFLEVDQMRLFSMFSVCKSWNEFQRDEFFLREWLTSKKIISSPNHAPTNRDYIWVMKSKKPVQDLDSLDSDKIEQDLISVGSKTFGNSLYEGEWKNGKRHGVGVFYWGILEHKDVTVYVGEWEEDRRKGQGKCYWQSGDRYEGEWEDDKSYGFGSFYWGTGSYYTGDWKEGRQNGKGRFAWKHGDTYDGSWKDGKQNGFGVFCWASGNKYIGNWLDDEKSNNGVFYWSNGDIYDGQWLKNKKNGRGTFIWENKDTYEGEWKDDKKTGYGKFTWASGDYFEGNWLKNKKSGIGKYCWTNGDSFDGNWEKGQQTGHGCNIWGNKNSFTGLWRTGEKLNGIFYEEPTKRSFYADCHYNLNHEYMHDSIREAIKKKSCTFGVTGTQCYFQYLWETKENVDRTHGVCIVCKELCVPKNGIKLLDEAKYHFGGNFYCDCSSGNLEKPCLAMNNIETKELAEPNSK